MTEKGKTPEWLFDLRVRERLLAAGSLDPKVLERHLAELPDLADKAEDLPFDQPALDASRGAG